MSHAVRQLINFEGAIRNKRLTQLGKGPDAPHLLSTSAAAITSSNFERRLNPGAVDCPCCQGFARTFRMLAHRDASGNALGARPVPAVHLRDLQQFQRWGAQKPGPDFGRFFSFGRKRYPDIVQESEDPLVLRQEADDIAQERFGSKELSDLADDMIAIMRQAPGVGLAAPQIGLAQKIIVLEDKEEYMRGIPPAQIEKTERKPFDVMVLCNPKLQAVGTEGFRYWEGCLSVRGYQAMVERYKTVKVTAKGIDGSDINFKATGWQARILQHECDHINGVLYIDRAIEETFTVMKPPSETGMEMKVKPGACICKHRLQ